MVKRLPNWLKIGLQSRFGPNFTVEFEAFFRKKIWPGTLRVNYAVHYPTYKHKTKQLHQMISRNPTISIVDLAVSSFEESRLHNLKAIISRPGGR